MDTPTQIILGAVTAELGFRKKLGRSAVWIAAAAALLPDLDILARPFISRLDWMMFHRGPTHSFVFAFAAPALVAWPFKKYSRSEGSFAWFYACGLAGAVSHPLLDLCTSYGTGVLWPFTAERFAWDFIGIVDFIYTGVLAATLAACAVVRRRGRLRAAVVIGAAGLALSCAYMGAGALSRHRAAGIARETAAAGGETPVRSEAYPKIGTIAAWRVVVETDEAFWVGSVNFLNRTPLVLHRLPNAGGHLVERAFAHPSAVKFLAFTMGMARVVIAEEGEGASVELHDMRYAFPAENPHSMWALRLTFPSDGGPAGAEIIEAFEDAGIGEVAVMIWREMWR